MVTKVELAEALADQSSKLAEELQNHLNAAISEIGSEIIDRLKEENDKLSAKIDLVFNLFDLFHTFSSLNLSGIPPVYGHAVQLELNY